MSRWSRPAARVVASLAAAALILFLLDKAVEWAERRGYVKTISADDMVRFVDAPLFELGADGWYRTTAYAEMSMLRSRFRAQKDGAWRLFALGESFVMGTPYASQGPDSDRPGGITSFLQADLQAMAPDREIEVVNLGAGSQNSHRVRRIAQEVQNYSPDVMLVAVCNNEGTRFTSADWVRESLRRYSGPRLIQRLTAPAPDPKKRSFYTPQDPDTSAVRDAFRENIHAILEGAAERDIRVVLATLPLNLRYTGRGVDPSVPRQPPSECLRRGLDLLAKGLPATEALRRCDDLETLRVLGRSEYDRGMYDEARRLLTQHVELVPLNRCCRPSFNEILRKEAAAFPNVRLVDLEKEAEALSPHGIPGQELFYDYCHMNWKGYAAMEDAILRTLDKADWLPDRSGPRPSREELRLRFGLDRNTPARDP